MDDRQLVKEALKARLAAYAPYSNFLVGAALLAKSGRVYHGCNIENAAYSPTNCAERTAVFKAISEGEREFCAIAIAGAPRGANPEEWNYCYPCGVCRQVLAEFCPPDFKVIIARSEDDFTCRKLDELLPDAFSKQKMNL